MGGSGTNVVNIGSQPGTPARSTVGGISSALSVSDPAGSAAINILDAADLTAHDATLSGFGVSTLSGVASAAISYDTRDVSALNLSMGNAATGSNDLSVAFGSGNPIPTHTTPGLRFQRGLGRGQCPDPRGHAPAADGGPGFVSEIHNAADPSVTTRVSQYRLDRLHRQERQDDRS